MFRCLNSPQFARHLSVSQNGDQRGVYEQQAISRRVQDCSGASGNGSGYSVAEVAARLDVTTHSLYAWLKKYGPDAATHQAKAEEQAEIRRLQKELKRVTEERDILKKAAAYFAKLSG
jgi:transposase